MRSVRLRPFLLVAAVAAAIALHAAPAAAQAGSSVLPAPDMILGATGPLLPTESPFALEQLRHSRVMDARIATRFNIKRLFHERGIAYPAAEVFMRIFKRERALEVWVRSAGDETFSLLKTYAICAMAGELGPKRRQGDAQAPEGFYNVDFFNPQSEYLLSLHLDYPNNRDRAVAPVGVDLGGDIFIHGGCNSDGCLALTDEGIREVYWLSVEARAAGQSRIPVHIFPARLDDDELLSLERAFAAQPDLPAFWKTLKPGYDYFESNRRVPAISVDGSGSYRVGESAAPLGSPATGPLGSPVGEPAGAATGEPQKPANGPLGSPVGEPAGAGTNAPQKPANGPLGSPVGGG